MILNQHIIIFLISDWSCDTEEYSNGCWKFSFAIIGVNYILKYIKIQNSYLNLSNISQYFTVFLNK